MCSRLLFCSVVLGDAASQSALQTELNWLIELCPNLCCRSRNFSIAAVLFVIGSICVTQRYVFAFHKHFGRQDPLISFAPSFLPIPCISPCFHIHHRRNYLHRHSTTSTSHIQASRYASISLSLSLRPPHSHPLFTHVHVHPIHQC